MEGSATSVNSSNVSHFSKARIPQSVMASSVSNAAPYAWYSADMTSEIVPGDDGVLIRIEAGPASGSLVVSRVELCLQAN